MKLFTLDTKKHLLNDLEIFTQNQRGTTGVTCTCKGGTTGKFQKIQKLLETLPIFKDIIKKYFVQDIIYFGCKKTCFELFRNYDDIK